MTKKKTTVKTLTVLPTKGIMGFLGDLVVITTLAVASITMLLLSLQIAQKITITVGK